MRAPILVLEDEALIALDIEDTLEGGGFTPVVICHDADGALNQIDAACPRFAFLDLNLGHGETSLPVARALLALHVPFVFLTGYTRATVDLPDDMGHVVRMSKPFKGADLILRAKKLEADTFR